MTIWVECMIIDLSNPIFVSIQQTDRYYPNDNPLMKAKDHITVILIERSGKIDLTVDHEGARVLGLHDEPGRSIRPNLLKKSRITQEQLMQLLERETECDDNLKKNYLIKKYIGSRKDSIRSDVYQLQKIARKIISHAENQKIAEDFLTSITQSPQPPCDEHDVFIAKKPHPWAKCLNCDEFYLEIPPGSTCVVCNSTVRNEVRPNTWFECQPCQGTGYNTRFNRACCSCAEKGWLFAELFKL